MRFTGKTTLSIMTEPKGRTEPRKTRGKSPKRVRYEANEREAQEEIEEYTREELPNVPTPPARYKP